MTNSSHGLLPVYWVGQKGTFSWWTAEAAASGLCLHSKALPTRTTYGLHHLGLKPMSRAWARCKHGNIFLSCRWSRNLGIKSKEGSKEEAPFSFCCSTVHSLILPSKMILKSYQCPFVSLNKQYQLPHHFSSTEALRNKNTRHTRHTVNLLLLKFQKHPKQYCSYYQNSTQNTTHA